MINKREQVYTPIGVDIIGKMATEWLSGYEPSSKSSCYYPMDSEEKSLCIEKQCPRAGCPGKDRPKLSSLNDEFAKILLSFLAHSWYKSDVIKPMPPKSFDELIR